MVLGSALIIWALPHELWFTAPRVNWRASLSWMYMNTNIIVAFLSLGYFACNVDISKHFPINDMTLNIYYTKHKL